MIGKFVTSIANTKCMKCGSIVLLMFPKGYHTASDNIYVNIWSDDNTKCAGL
jgi:hypothetical protein